MNIVDTSAWIEYFIGGPNRDFFAEVIESESKIIIPTIIIYELWKKISKEVGSDKAVEVVAQLKRFEIMPLTEEISIMAAETSNKYKMAMADSIIYATSVKYNATIWTQDDDFKNLKNVKYRKKQK